MPAKMPAVIFDLDGTLIDSAPDIHASANRVFAAHGQSFTPEEVRRCIGHGAPHLLRQLAGLRGLPQDDAFQAALLTGFLEVYEAAQDLTRLYPGVEQALADLAASGARLAICTNKPLGPTRAVLRHFGLEARFPVVIGGDSLDRRKPDPAPLLAALDQIGGGPAVFVGDSEVDAETAQAARLPFLLYTMGYRKTPVAELAHDAAFSDFAALPQLVADLTRG